MFEDTVDRSTPMMRIIRQTVWDALEVAQEQAIKGQVQYRSIHQEVVAVLRTTTTPGPSPRYSKAVRQICQLLLEDLAGKITGPTNYRHLIREVVPAGSQKAINGGYLTPGGGYVSWIDMAQPVQV